MTQRLSKLRSLLKKQSLDAVLISSIPNIIYLTDFSYFSSLEREAFLLITKKAQYIVTDGRYSHAVKQHVKNFQLLEITHGHRFDNHLSEIINIENIKSLGIDERNITVSEHKRISIHVKRVKHFDLSELRAVKEPQEIAVIKKACELGDRAFAYILKKIKEGLSEKEVALEIEMFLRKNGADNSFSTIVAFEENAAIPHHKTGNRKLKKNEIVLLDFGVKYKNYCSDMTRTVFFGKATGEKKRMYNTVLEAQRKAVEFLNKSLMKNYSSSERSESRSYKFSTSSNKNVIKAMDVDKAARSRIISQKYPTIPHSLGHGIGLEVHEAPSLFPKSNDELKSGMVFSIEPGIYLPNDVGVRIEDLFTIQNNKLIQLTKAPKNLIEQ